MDLTRYFELRDATRNAAMKAQSDAASVATAEQALSEAQATYDEAVQNAETSKTTWQSAERAENQEAAKHGIEPCVTG